jgi:signal transduction histidine kinase
MLGYQLLYLISLVTFTFGALTFSVLTLFYWKQRRLRLHSGGGLIFPAFTVVCAAAFLMNLLLRMVPAGSEDSPAAMGLSMALDLATGLLPPLLLHLIYREEEPGLLARGVWAWLLTLFYLASAATAGAKSLADANLLDDRWGDRLDSVPALRLAVTGAVGLLLQILSRRRTTAAERRHRWWNRVLLCLTVLVAALNLAQAPPIWGLLPDYLVLSFFCVTLYYKERLVFFDLLIKRGAFFALSLMGLTAFFAITPPVLQRLPADWSRPWIAALLLTPLWLVAPWIYRRLAQTIDRVWLRRRYSPVEAERQFVRAIQVAGSEDELRSRATGSLSDIFQAPAQVCFEAQPEPSGSTADGLCAALEQQGAPIGWMALAARPNSIPYLSDDRRLLQSLARTLGVVTENVRFRQRQQQQEEREQQLRWLASRAELRALRAQINPHFLFNALNAIAGLIPDQPQLADETVERLAQVFRYTLRKSEREWARLDEEVEFAAAYLRVEQARFGERLRVEFQVDAGTHAIAVPAMSIQPLIENAIKHGVSAVEGRGTVRLSAGVQGEALCIDVFDNGPGFPAGFSLTAPVEPNGGGYGLRNVAKRLQGYYGDAAQLVWKNGAEGTHVTVRIPHPPPHLTGRPE